jgi:hypothetical protein
MFKILINFFLNNKESVDLSPKFSHRIISRGKHQTYPSSDFKCNIAHIERETLRLMDVVVSAMI